MLYFLCGSVSASPLMTSSYPQQRCRAEEAGGGSAAQPPALRQSHTVMLSLGAGDSSKLSQAKHPQDCHLL